MKKITIAFVVVPVVIGVFLFTSGNNSAGQTSFEWAVIGTVFIGRGIPALSVPENKVVRPINNLP